MIVNSERALALICPACQEVQKHRFSAFAISRQPFQFVCQCGFSQGHLRRLRKNYELDVLSLTGERIRLLFSLREFLYLPLMAIYASKNGREVGFFGNRAIVEEVVENDFNEEVPLDLGGVHNPEIMHEILEKLRKLAEQQKIRCECEQPCIGIDVYPDKVELVCAFCGSVVLIGASTSKHRERVDKVSEIVMEPSTCLFLEEWLKPLN